MQASNLKTALKNEILLFDGAMGTALQPHLDQGVLCEVLNLTHPDVVQKIHCDYVAAGCDIVTANTFGANGCKLNQTPYSVQQVVKAAVRLARAAHPRFVALDVGSLGELLMPAGTLSFQHAIERFSEQIRAGVEAGVDCILIETMSDLYEAKAAVIAAKECCDLPIVVSMTYDENLRTFMGCDAMTQVVFLNAIGVDAIGVNCSHSPKRIQPIVDTLTRFSRVPVLVMPNAGLPVCGADGKSTYSVTRGEFCDAAISFYKKGATLFGGCCGTDPSYLAALAARLKGKKPKKRKIEFLTAICSGTSTVHLGDKTAVIGERINPTGKPLLKQALRAGELDFVCREAIEQHAAGADILDVNCGLPDLDEAKMLSRVVSELQSVVDLPLVIDSASPEAVEQAVRSYNGKPLINSVNGEPASMERVFPIAKKYGAAVIGLTLDNHGIPDTAEGRLNIARRIVETAQSYGIPREDIWVDCLVLTASAQQAQVMQTIRAITLVKHKLGVKTVLGVSNVSYGLPNRPFLNSIFLTAALAAGLDAAILNPKSCEMMDALAAFRVLSGEDKAASRYIASVQQGEKPMKPPAVGTALQELILHGQRDAAIGEVRRLLAEKDPLCLVEEYLVPALEQTGARFEKGQIFLPQLVGAAECAKACAEEVKKSIPSGSGLQKGTVLLATVRGDIHDIGKNIAKVLLQSYGYEVLDLGKDVDGESIAQAALQHQIRLIGLSALMTTTIPAMKDAIVQIRKACPNCRIMVGGAVITDEYAKLVGADYYAKDAQKGVEIANNVFGG